MSTKKQISSFCKLYSVYEEKLEEFLDETDVDTFITTFWTFHSPTTEEFELAKDPAKSPLHSKSSFLQFKVTSAFFSQGRSQHFQKQIESLLDGLGDFFKAFDQANKLSQIPLPEAKFEIGLTKAKDELFSHCYKDIVEPLNRQIRLSFRFEKNKTSVFPVKKFEQYGDQFIPTDVVNLNHREIHHL